MSDFGETWRLVRGRFDDTVIGLTQEQLNWRLHDDALTIGEMAIHVAGVEVSFMSQLLGQTPEGELARVKSASTDGVVNDNPFPFSPDEITPDRISWALDEGRKLVEAHIENLAPDIRAVQITSALGPIIDGTGAFARMAYHPGYHQGQAHLTKTAPGFPN
ncbi:MAG: DinB family protein [Fimbriimonadaceae bacterium]|nr:DinB family protein [Fimbriimonadaceae bacterium]